MFASHLIVVNGLIVFLSTDINYVEIIELLNSALLISEFADEDEVSSVFIWWQAKTLSTGACRLDQRHIAMSNS